MYLDKLFLILLVWLCCGDLISQRSLTTTSGQKIVLHDDGTWEKEIRTLSEDTSGMLVTAFNPLTAPKVEKYEIDEKQKLAITLLIDKARANEINNLVSIESLNKQISGKELELSQAKLNKNKSAIKTVDTEIDDLKSKLKELNSEYSTSTAQIQAIEKLKEYNPSSRVGKMKSISEDLKIDISAYISDENLDPSFKPQSVKNDKKNVGCNLMKDEMNGKSRVVQTENALLFDYTPEKLKTYFKTNNLLKTNASIRKEGKDFFLHLQISIMSKDAAKNYGFIAEGSLMKIFLVNGRNIALHSGVKSSTRIENYTGNTIYDVFYPINKDALNNLMKFPLDTLGIMWSSGFEKYEIYQVDIFMNQLNCLKSI
jgi:hypothetical protein